MKKSKLKKKIDKLKDVNFDLSQRLELVSEENENLIAMNGKLRKENLVKLSGMQFRVVCQECKDRMLSDSNTNVTEDPTETYQSVKNVNHADVIVANASKLKAMPWK